MDTAATDLTEPHPVPAPAIAEKHALPKPTVDKFTEARMAKKKQRRARHRARLRRSHTDG